MENYIKLDSIENALWNKRILNRLSNYIVNADKCVFERFFTNNVFTKHIKLYLENVLELSNDTILKVYWEEFKTIRNLYKTAYILAVNDKNDKKKKFGKYNFPNFQK
jgi:hypothetical protein